MSQLTTGFAAAALLSLTCATQAGIVHDNSIYFEDFPVDGNLTVNSKIAEVLGTLTVGSSVATTAQDLGGTAALRSAAFDFSASPNEWTASTRFRVNALDTVSTRQFHLLSGTNSPAPLGTDNWEVLGFDLRLEESGGNPGAATFDLTWFGWDNRDASRATQSVSGGSDLTKGIFYDLLIHRLPNDTIDIWLDGSLIDSKPLLVGAAGGTNVGQENPTRLQFGDFSSHIQASVSIDYLSVGRVIPEPSSLFLLAIGGMGVARVRRRR